MPPGLSNWLARSFDKRLELAIGGQGELLCDRRRKDALAIVDLVPFTGPMHRSREGAEIAEIKSLIAIVESRAQLE